MPSAATVLCRGLSPQIDDGLRDSAFGFDGLGVRLIVALGDDQIDQLVRKLDVGVFQRTCLQGTERTGAGRIADRLA